MMEKINRPNWSCLCPARWTACLAAIVLCMPAGPAQAQYSSDPASNLAVGFGGGDQVQPKIIPTYGDGGCYISWFDNATGGYDVRIQRLDAAGNPMFGDNGILVADRSYSSTQDYGLAVDAANNAFLAFRTDQHGGDRIEVQRVNTNGSLPWGTDGVVLGDGTNFVASPKVTVTTDGNIVVAWTSDSNVDVVRLDTEGNDVWGQVISIIDGGGLNLSLSDLQPGDSQSAILSYVQQGSFFSPRHLLAQKLDIKGATLWGDNGVTVYDGGSLQTGNFPYFVSDGAGGAVFSWYDTSLQSYVQHIDASGNEVFAHNGVAVASNGTNIRVSPRADYNPTTQEIFVCWTEEDANQASRGVSAQKIDASGNLEWGAAGKEIAPLQNLYDYQVSTTAFADGAIVWYSESPSFGQDTISAARLASDGSFVWSGSIVPVSTTPAQKFRLSSALMSTADQAVLVWEDNAGDANILAQNVNADGSLGSSAPNPPTLSVTGNCPGSMTFAIDNATPGGNVAFIYGLGHGMTIPQGNPCAGTTLSVGGPRLGYRIAGADGSGHAELTTGVPNAACGHINVQGLDVASCTTTNVVQP